MEKDSEGVKDLAINILQSELAASSGEIESPSKAVKLVHKSNFSSHELETRKYASPVEPMENCNDSTLSSLPFSNAKDHTMYSINSAQNSNYEMENRDDDDDRDNSDGENEKTDKVIAMETRDLDNNNEIDNSDGD